MNATVLVCDDERVLRALLRHGLEAASYTVAEACDGDESLELARRLRPDLILLDAMMPGRSGLEVLTELRSDPELAATPVIVLTARTQAADRAAIAGAGADRFLAKPFRLAELTATVAELLDRG